MQIKILGTRGEIKTSQRRHKKHSGILIDKKILLDVGERNYLHHQSEIILITHLHPDHAFFVTEQERAQLRIPVYAPETSSRLQGIKILTKPLVIDDYKIIPIPVVHSLKVKSQGYLIEKGKKRIFYSGDVVEINSRYLHKLYDLDAVITEASFIRNGGVIRTNAEGKKFGHAGIPDLVEFFSRFTSRIIFTHFGTWFIKDTSSGAAKLKKFENPNLKIDVAFDGVTYSI